MRIGTGAELEHHDGWDLSWYELSFLLCCFFNPWLLQMSGHTHCDFKGFVGVNRTEWAIPSTLLEVEYLKTWKYPADHATAACIPCNLDPILPTFHQSHLSLHLERTRVLIFCDVL